MTVTASPLPHIIVATVRCSPSQQKSVNGMENHSPIPAAPLTVTHPFKPLSRGETYHSKLSLSNKKQHIKTPLLRGAGVCDVCAQLPKSKTSTRSRQILPRNNKLPETAYRNILSPASLLTITHPLVPSLEGKTSHSNHSLPNRKQHPNSPPERRKLYLKPFVSK